MLHKAKILSGYALESRDGIIGKVREFYFDDQHWAIRYLVADTGAWLAERQVLISPYALAGVNKENRLVAVDLTKKQIEDSPPLDSDKPVSRHFEESYHGHYGWPFYWSGPHMWGVYPSIDRGFKERKIIAVNGKAPDAHLRSTHDVSGHHIQAADGEIGHVEDFLIDDGMWAIRYLIIDTKNWRPGKKVLISPRWIERISWPELKVFVNLSREDVRQSPEYTEASLITRDYETKLHRHYQRQEYWVDEPPRSIAVEANTAKKTTRRARK